MQRVLLTLYDVFYQRVARPFLFRMTAQEAHTFTLGFLRLLDRRIWLLRLLAGFRQWTAPDQPVTVGGVNLPGPLIVAAGLVKGSGFTSEDEALAMVRSGANIMPGWRAMPVMAGLVEFGSFTRWPRLGNSGTVVWRDVDTRSTQNRVGLKNPGVQAAAEFLALRRDQLPPVFGINIAVSPGVDDPQQQTAEVLAGLAAFLDRGVIPSWFTINLSCPNTEDDPGGNQTADLAAQLGGAAVDYLNAQHQTVPLWVKVGPELADEQYKALLREFARAGVQAVIATNTTAQPTPDDPAVVAGVGGGNLHGAAVQAAASLVRARDEADILSVDIIGCGGVLDHVSYSNFANQGVPVAQYWSALVFRGPFVAALIQQDI